VNPLPEKAETDVALYEVHGDFSEHMEKGSRRVMTLSVITLVVSVLLLASYLSEIVYPFATGQTSVTVNLSNPSLLAFEVVLVLLTLAWLYVGTINLVWARRIAANVRRIKKNEVRIQKSIES